eukprot:6185655-Pleurochrysis_carterae.AAC.2
MKQARKWRGPGDIFEMFEMARPRGRVSWTEEGPRTRKCAASAREVRRIERERRADQGGRRDAQRWEAQGAKRDACSDEWRRRPFEVQMLRGDAGRATKMTLAEKAAASRALHVLSMQGKRAAAHTRA